MSAITTSFQDILSNERFDPRGGGVEGEAVSIGGTAVSLTAGAEP